jgi:hypothetical protein
MEYEGTPQRIALRRERRQPEVQQLSFRFLADRECRRRWFAAENELIEPIVSKDVR